MADLDNFFAKKDKKKLKPKKFLTAEEVAKKLEEDSSKRIEQQSSKPIREKEVDKTEITVQFVNVEQTEEEWKDFEEIERKDYSGLKIGQMSVDENDLVNSGLEGEYDEYGSDGEGVNRDRKQGPWKPVQPAEVSQLPVEVAKSTSNIYISPAFKSAAKTSIKFRNRNAPDITNSEFFPTLGAARPDDVRKKKNEIPFEEVKHGVRSHKIQEVRPTSGANVGNRFKTLNEDNS